VAVRCNSCARRLQSISHNRTHQSADHRSSQERRFWREALAIVRYDLDKINAEFKDRLDAKPKVPLSNFSQFSVDYKKLVAFEKDGVATFPEFIGDRVITVNVTELLNGVDLDAQRGKDMAEIVNAKAIFFSYSHKDEDLRDELETHLKLLQRRLYFRLA
jgi:internalin A